jgi:uncharacterized Zn finger protein
MKNFNCPVCSATSSLEEMFVDDFYFYKCSKCGFVSDESMIQDHAELNLLNYDGSSEANNIKEEIRDLKVDLHLLEVKIGEAEDEIWYIETEINELEKLLKEKANVKREVNPLQIDIWRENLNI